MKKKVLYIITKSNWGGAQRYVFDLATSLPQEQFEPVVALGGTGAPDATRGTLDSKLRAQGIRTVLVPSFMRDLSLLREYRALRELIDIIRNERPDVVHLNSSKAGGLGALAARLGRWPTPEGMLRAEIVFTVHGFPFEEDRHALWRSMAWLGTWLTFLLCDRVIVISRDALTKAASLPWCRNKATLVHNGIASLTFKAPDEARDVLKLPIGVPVIGAVANLEWNKGLHYLLRAAGKLKREGRDFRVCLVGDGEERTFMHTIIKEEDIDDRIVLAGFVPDAWQYLKAFDIFALPSVKEGLPYALMEAGQAGLPCVGSNLPGIAEIIGNRVSGLLFKPKDHHNLATQLKLLLDDAGMRHRLGDNLKARIDSEFSLKRMVEQTAALY